LIVIQATPFSTRKSSSSSMSGTPAAFSPIWEVPPRSQT
jgi:hypothetical protein